MSDVQKKVFVKKQDNKILFICFSLFSGILIGSLILFFSGYDPISAWQTVIIGSFTQPNYIANIIIYATPLILTGLSVSFAFKTGLFNIGVEGQFIMGALVATLAGQVVGLPPFVHIVFVIFMAMVAAALWGGFAGILKAVFGINEVITTIMLNWIALYLNNFIVNLDFIKAPGGAKTLPIQPSASIQVVSAAWKKTADAKVFLADNPFFASLLKPSLNWGILIAILAAIICYLILKRTTIGYQLKAVGFNKYSAEYGGINIKRGMIVAMAISGALAGLAGAVHVMGNANYVTQLSSMEGYGFDGIAVSLIGNSSPLGCILSGLLFGFFRYGGSKLQLSTNSAGIPAPTEMVNIIIGIIIFFIAMPKLITIVKNYFNSVSLKKGD